MGENTSGIIRVAIPKGHMQESVTTLLREAGIKLGFGARSYRPSISLPGFEAKMLKPQSIVKMLHIGSRDLGFTGADWIAELDGGAEELLDTELDPVRLVAAAPEDLLINGELPKRPLVVASEYEKISRDWIAKRGLDATFVRSYGATEVFPPEDADCIVDNTATGSTLRANRLRILDELMTSSTRLYANPKALKDPAKREAIDRVVMLLSSVIEARKRVMLEVNVPADKLDELVNILPCMKRPTIAHLYHEDSYAVKVAAPRDALPTLIPLIKAMGCTDIIVIGADQIVP
jgi:ATP phosphoribosyltransferase